MHTTCKTPGDVQADALRSWVQAHLLQNPGFNVRSQSSLHLRLHLRPRQETSLLQKCSKGATKDLFCQSGWGLCVRDATELSMLGKGRTHRIKILKQNVYEPI